MKKYNIETLIYFKIIFIATFVICMVFFITACNTQKDKSKLPEDFVMVTDIVPDIILEIRYYSTYNFVGERIDGYNAPIAILTKKAAEALKVASDDLEKQGYVLKIGDAYRPQTAVNYFEKWA